MGDERHGAEVLHGIVGELSKEVRVDGVRGDGADAHRHAVAGLLGKVRDADVAAGARLVVHDDVAEIGAHGFRNRAGGDVKRASGRVGNDDANGIGPRADLSEGKPGIADEGSKEGGAYKRATIEIGHFIFL